MGAEIITGLIAEGIGIRHGTCDSGMGASTTAISSLDLSGFGRFAVMNEFPIADPHRQPPTRPPVERALLRHGPAVQRRTDIYTLDIHFSRNFNSGKRR